MPNQQKKLQKGRVIAQIQESLSRSSICILTNYKGLTAPDMTELRRRTREAKVEFRVVKNTMARFAAERADKKQLAPLFDGPVAIACGYEDPTIAARVLADFNRTAKTALEIKGGLLGNQLLGANDISALVALPSRQVLLSQVLGGIQAPLVRLFSTLNSPLQGLMIALNSRIKQMEVKS